MFTVSVRARGLLRFLYANALLCLLFLLSTAIVLQTFYKSPGIADDRAYLLGQFALSHENTVATWYSAMLLLATALVGLLVYWAETTQARSKTHGFFSHGWLFIVCAFLLMSFDEMGSMHENIGNFSIPNAVIPLCGAIGILYILSFAWFFLRRSLVAVIFLSIGCCLFISIPIQEHFEMSMWREAGFSSTWQRPIRFILMEEGAELLASLSFLAGMIYYLVSRHSRSPVITFRQRPTRIFSFVISLFLVASILCLIIQLKRPPLDAHSGDALNWLPSSILMLMAFYGIIKGKKTRMLHFIILTGLSCTFGSDFYTVLHWQDVAIATHGVALMMIAGVAYILYSYVVGEQRNIIVAIAALLWAVSVFTLLIYPNGLVPVFVFVSSVLLFCCDLIFVKNMRPLISSWRTSLRHFFLMVTVIGKRHPNH
ncbi:MAG TPA: hypothetical protein VD927_17245 [Chryseosolibacter sp.]|nr:hypothetical protein [Chryseosolibacter sp.]